MESSAVLVTNQFGGTGCANQHLLVANPFTGALLPGEDGDLGRPTAEDPAKPYGAFNEAKPFDSNRKIVGLWGGSSEHNQSAGIGIYDRELKAWANSFDLPPGFEKGAEGAHSVAVLPDGYFAVAHTGSIAGSSQNGYVVVFSPSGAKIQQIALTSAHGVEWDGLRDHLFAVGANHVKKYSYSPSNHTIAEVASYPLPTTGGHDLRRRRVDNDFFVTTNTATYVFRPDEVDKFDDVRKSDNTLVGGGVKSIDQRFDGVTEYGYWQQDYFYFTDRQRIQAQFCMSPYKGGRWLYGIGEPVYPEDEAPTSTTQADPFLWASKLVRPNSTSPIWNQWVGGAAWANAGQVENEIKQQVADGKTPFLYFYHWGDNGSPPMKRVQEASQSQIDGWEDFGRAIARGIGSASAYVVIEPEWDSNINGACSSKYEGALKRIIDNFKTVAPNARLINGPGLWNQNDDAFSCFADAAKWFHSHGFIDHVVSNNPECTRTTDGSHYGGGYTRTDALKIVERVRDRADRVKRLFGGGNVILTDLGVTRCGWGNDTQAQIFANLVDALPALYNEIGLRGVQIRRGGPAEHERFMGVENEGQFNYAGFPGEAEINRGVTVTQNHLKSISSTSPSDPTFASSATAPAKVAPGEAALINATVTNTGGSLSDGIVDIEVEDAGGKRVGQRFFTDQSFANGASRDYQYSWGGSLTPGTYKVNIGVFGADWTPEYDWNAQATTITVGSAQPSFSSSASADPSTVSPGAQTTVDVAVTNTGGTLQDGIVDIEIYSPTGTRVEQRYFSGQTIVSGTTSDYTFAWTAPLATGTYSVRVGVFGSGWTPQYHWNGAAGSVEVSPPRFTSRASVSPTAVAPGGQTTVTATIDNNGPALSDGIVDLEVYDSTGTRVSQKFWSGQSIASGASKTYTWNWTSPSSSGSYTLKIGVFGTGWNPTHHWNAEAAIIGVTAPVFETGASASPSAIAPAGSSTITAEVTNTGGTLENGIVDLEIFNSAGTRVAQKFWSGETLTNGTTRSFQWSWTAPSETGTYTVKLGVFGAGWTPTYHWNNAAATISVRNPFQPNFTVGDGSNTWWIEIYTSDDVTAVDVIGDNGRFYMSLPKKSWGAWAASPPSELLSGQPIRLIARRSSDGSTAASTNFGWLTQSPSTEPGWASTFTLADGINESWIEVYVSSEATSVEAKVNKGPWTALTKRSWGSWAKSMTAPTGSRVTIRATRADGARAYSTIYEWLQ